MLILVTGAAGKVGQTFIRGVLDDVPWPGARLRALCHNRTLAEAPGLEVVRGDIADRDFVGQAMEGVTHVVHLATCKETPSIVMDVTVKGLFWLLEAFRASPSARQFVLIGGDAGVGHFHYRHDGPVTETTPHRAYPGCYALSKVLEEVMVEQYGVQYGLNWCCLRAPWIMEKDDFRHTLSFGDDVFGAPDWKTLVAPEVAERCRREQTTPLLRDADGRPLRRNFVHVEDLVAAIVAAIDNPRAVRRLYNICMTEPVDYGVLAEYLGRTRARPWIDIPSGFHSTWMDNSRARFELGWSPRYDLERMIEASWAYERAPDDPRKIWYPG
jgi:nucleoside-diphosphate-sugar epimerase